MTRTKSHWTALSWSVVAGMALLPALAAAQPAESDVFQALQPTDGGLTVESVVARVLSTSPGVDRAEAGADRARSTARRAWVGYLPRTDFSGTYTRLSKVESPPFEFDPDGPGPTQPLVIESPFPVFLDLYSFDATVAFPVSDYFLQVVHGYAASQDNAEIAALQLRAARENAALQATEAYINVIRARAARIVTSTSVRALTANLADVGALVDAGIVPEADRKQVQAQLGSARVAQGRAEGVLTVAETALRKALHRPDDFPVAHGENFFELPDVRPPARDEVLQRALAHRPELLAMKRLVAMQERWVKYYRGGKMPKLALNAQGQYANPNQRYFPLVDEYHETWAVGASVRWSPNDFITNNELMNDAKMRLYQAQADQRAIEDGIHTEVDQSLTFYDVSRRSIDAAAEALEAARADYHDRQTLLSAGDATTRDLLASEAALRNAELQLVNAYLDVRVAQARLERAMGSLAPESAQEKNR